MVDAAECGWQQVAARSRSCHVSELHSLPNHNSNKPRSLAAISGRAFSLADSDICAEACVKIERDVSKEQQRQSIHFNQDFNSAIN